MQVITNKNATARTPRVVTMILSDSRSMQDLAEHGESKAQVATESLRNMVMAVHVSVRGPTGFGFLLNIAKFADGVTPIVETLPPARINLQQLAFRGDSGRTQNMSDAVKWAAAAVEKALTACRALSTYDESAAPPPLVVFLSDGENTGPEVHEAAEKLKTIPFRNGSVGVIACGIGMKPEHFSVMKAIASSPEFALNIDPTRMAEFIAGIGATIAAGGPNTDIVKN